MQVDPDILDEHIEGKLGAGGDADAAQFDVLQIFIVADGDVELEQILLSHRVTRSQLSQGPEDKVIFGMGLRQGDIVIPVEAEGRQKAVPGRRLEPRSSCARRAGPGPTWRGTRWPGPPPPPGRRV